MQNFSYESKFYLVWMQLIFIWKAMLQDSLWKEVQDNLEMAYYWQLLKTGVHVGLLDYWHSDLLSLWAYNPTAMTDMVNEHIKNKLS